MKILQVGKFYHPDHGGIETVIQNLSEGLVSKGHEVTVLCTGSDSDPTQLHGVQIHRIPSYGTVFSQPLSLQLPLVLKNSAQNFDIVHVHTPNPLAETSSLLLSQEKPLVVSYHSDIVRQKILLPFYQPFLRKFLKKAQNIVVATKNHVEYSPHLIHYQEKCKIVPYGINDRSFQNSSEKTQLAQSIKNQYGPFVLFVGRLVEYKGVDILIQAIKKTSTNAVIIGEGPLKSTLLQKTKDLDLQDRVHFIGSLGTSEELAPYYEACEAFALPSISANEAFGMVQLEAMASAKPVIVSQLNSGISLVQEEGVTGLHFKPSDPDDLARAIHQILKDKNQLEKMGRAARKKFETHYSQEKMVDGYLKIYEALS